MSAALPPVTPNEALRRHMAAAVQVAGLSDSETDVPIGGSARKRARFDPRAGSRLATVALVQDDEVLALGIRPAAHQPEAACPPRQPVDRRRRGRSRFSVPRGAAESGRRAARTVGHVAHADPRAAAMEEWATGSGSEAGTEGAGVAARAWDVQPWRHVFRGVGRDRRRPGVSAHVREDLRRGRHLRSSDAFDEPVVERPRSLTRHSGLDRTGGRHLSQPRRAHRRLVAVPLAPAGQACGVCRLAARGHEPGCAGEAESRARSPRETSRARLARSGMPRLPPCRCSPVRADS